MYQEYQDVSDITSDHVKHDQPKSTIINQNQPISNTINQHKP